MKVIFGEVKGEIKKNDLTERLSSCKATIEEQMPRLWERLPEQYRKSFQMAYFIRVKDYKEMDKEVRFSAEWDEIYPYSFRGKELWGARTNYAGVRLKDVGSPWIMAVEGDWSVATRIGRMALDKRGQVRNLEIPSSVLRKTLENDSRAEIHMWWREIEEGVDGSLRGALPKRTGTRSRFDKAGEPYFAKFESMELGCVVSISCKQGSISSKSLTSDRMIEYFEKWILPNLHIGR